MTSQQLPRIGFIGLGNMGGRMAKNLHNAGYPLINPQQKPCSEI